MGCGCGKKTAPVSPGWTVDLTDTSGGTTLRFPDNTSKKTFATVGEANIAIARLGLAGKVRPRAARAGDTA